MKKDVSAKVPPRLRPARLDDYTQIQHLEASHGLLSLRAEDWRRFWVECPLYGRLGHDWPIGWVLEDAEDRVVGSLANIPSLYTFEGRELVAATGRGWVVAPEYRSTALWLMDEYFNQDGVDLFINTTVNGLAVEAFRVFGSAQAPVGDWQTAAFRVTAHRGFAGVALRLKGVPLAEGLAYPVGAGLWLKDLVMSRGVRPTGTFEIDTAETFDDRFDAFWEELVRSNPQKLLGLRDRQTLAWHFAGPLRAGDLWTFTVSRGGLLRAYALFKRQDHPPSGLTRMRLVDYQALEPDRDLLSDLLRPALRRAAAEGFHLVEMIGGDLPQMRPFYECAPYRRRLPAWSFYYKATDAGLDTALRDAGVWAPSGYDGDTSL